MKVLLDSNVIVSALAARGLCNAIFELCIERYEIIISNSIINEINGILKGKFRAPDNTIISFMEYVREFFTIAEDKNNMDLCRDKDDNKILSVAVDNQVSYLITGDNDLLVLKEIKGTKIVNPRTFWEICRKSS